MTSSDNPVPSAEKSIDTSLSSDRYGRENLLIRDDLQKVANKLQYDRSLTEEAREQLIAFQRNRESDLELLKREESQDV